MIWEPTGPDEDKTARLTGHARPSVRVTDWVPALSIEGVYMHVEAYAVVDTTDGEQIGAHEWSGTALDAISMIDEGVMPVTTAIIEVDGVKREYVIVAYPYGA